jgi:hypothetical protein
MKRILLLACVVLAAASCKTITPEARIAEIDGFFNGKEDTYTAKLQQYQGDTQLDYLDLVLSKDLNAKDIWTIESDGGETMVAEFPGKEKNAPLSMISASLDDPAACAAILEVLEAFKELKIQHKNTIRAVFYAPAPDSTQQSGLAVINEDIHASKEINLFDIELSTSRQLARHTFCIEDTPAFAQQLIDALPAYFKPLGDYHFVLQKPDPAWPLKGTIYRYDIQTGEFQKEVAAITAFTFLLN